MSRVALIAIISLLCVSCAPHRAVSTSQRDSVRVEVVERQVVVRDTVVVSIPRIEQSQEVLCDESTLQNEYAISQARIMPDGLLFHSLATLPQQIHKPIASPVTLRDSVIYRERVTRQIVEVERQLTAWQRLAISGFNFLLLFFVGLLLLRLKI